MPYSSLSKLRIFYVLCVLYDFFFILGHVILYVTHYDYLIQEVDEFVFFIRTDLEKFTITSLAHQWIPCSEWVPPEWVKTADKSITIIHK